MAKEKPSGWLDKYSNNVAASDATRVTKQLTPLNAKKVTQRELNEREAQSRRDKIAKANAAKDKMYTNPDEPIFGFSPEVFAESTSAIGDKLRTSEYPNIFDDYLNPIPFLGELASGLGQIPLNLKQRDYIQAGLNLAAPALAGAGERGIEYLAGVTNKLGNKTIYSPFNSKPSMSSGKPSSLMSISLPENLPGNEHLYYGRQALGNEMGVASDRELKEAYEEAMDKLKPRELRTIRDYGMMNSKALAIDMRLKFADRMPMFTDPNALDKLDGNNMTPDIRTIFSKKFLKDQGYDVSKLTPQERALMHGYARGFDSFFNKRGNPDLLSKYASPETLGFYDDLSNQLNLATQKNKLITDKSFNRSSDDYTLKLLDPSTYQPVGASLRSELQRGDIFMDEGFMSTSLPHYNYGAKYTEKINAPGGSKQSFLFPNSMASSPYANEEEIILPKGLIRRVEDLETPGNITTSILNPYKNGGWLEKYNDGGPVQENYNDYTVSASPDFQGDGYSNVGRNYSPAWGGQFAMGGSVPGTVGFMYARTNDPAPSEGPYAKKTEPSAENGTEMAFYQNGLDWKPKTISKNGSELKKLDQLTNFTNYNPTQPSGWLEKYQ